MDATPLPTSSADSELMRAWCITAKPTTAAWNSKAASALAASPAVEG